MNGLAHNLVRELEALPTQNSVAMRILWTVDDPAASAGDLAGAIGMDPSLTARVMKLANSAFYGLGGRVSSAAFAVTVLGFSTIGSLAAAAAAGVLDDDADVPSEFWDHATLTAAASSLVAARVGANRPEAFSAGLLHDLGRALLYRADPDGYRAVADEARNGGRPLLVGEREAFGLDHAEVAAQVLTVWRFPAEFVQALAVHHADPAAATSGLARSLVAGEALLHDVLEADEHRPEADLEAALRLAGLDNESAEFLCRRAQQESSNLVLL